MKFITYNIRGLGRGLKWASIRKLVKEERIDMLYLQETKREGIERRYAKLRGGILRLDGRYCQHVIVLEGYYVYGMRRHSD